MDSQIYARTPDGGFAPATHNGPGAKYVNWNDTDENIAITFGVTRSAVQAQRPAGREMQTPANRRDPVLDADIPDEREAKVATRASFGGDSAEPEVTVGTPPAKPAKSKKGK